MPHTRDGRLLIQFYGLSFSPRPVTPEPDALAGSTVEVLMVHENDAERGGCEFNIFLTGARQMT